jgi:hypothetical protein
MLVPYTHISQLTEDQKQRLKTFLGGRILEGHAYVQFEGMTLSVREVQMLQQLWESQAKPRQILHG